MSRVGEKIKKLRTEAGLSQKQLAKKLGVAENFLYEVELGRKVVNESLINKLTKVFNKDINDITMSFDEEADQQEREAGREFSNARESAQQRVVKTDKISKSDRVNQPEVSEVWSEAFGSVLKKVPVLKYDLRTVITSKQLPLISNKIEGYAADKVFYLQIEEEDMIGFRISKGDIALAHTTHEIENNGICLVEFNDERVIRQIKKLDSNKVLLISNRGTLRTETANVKEVKVLARLVRLEITL